MNYRLVRLAMAVATVLGAALAASPAIASPAIASTARPAATMGNIFIFCEASGNFCKRDSNNASTAGNPIVEAGRVFGPATQSAWHETTGTFTVDGIIYPIGELIYDQHPGWCDGLDASDLNVVLEPCNGNGTVWGISTRNGADIFVSRPASQQDGTLVLLSGMNNGGQLQAQPSGRSGYFQRWSFVHN